MIKAKMSKKIVEGRILKGTGGLYAVETPEGIFSCKARGIFRKDGRKPLAGDLVSVETDGQTSSIVQIADRRNYLNRPPVANVNSLVILSAAASPAPNLLLIDRMTSIAIHRNIQPIPVFSKCDIQDMHEFVEIYKDSGFLSFAFSSKTGEGIENFEKIFGHGVCVLTGNSGVGKSTLLNRLYPSLALETGEISRKLGRGRHTTRMVELYPIDDGYIADTPGFSSLDFESGGWISKYELAECFPDFAPFRDQCRFTGCSHTVEKGCAVIQAVKEGKILPSRHENYKKLYAEVNVLDWQANKK